MRPTPLASWPSRAGLNPTMTDETRATKITFGEMRASGVHRILISCSDYRCSQHTAADADGWPNVLRLSDIESRFVCAVFGRRGADVRLDFPTN
jgi:hypothetical protein